MKLLKIINEGLQWVVIVALLILLLNFDFDFLSSAPKVVSEIELIQSQQQESMESIEGRLSQLESSVKEITGNPNVVKLQQQVDELRSHYEKLASSSAPQPASQSSTTEVQANEVAPSDGIPWYKQDYARVGAVAAFLLLILLFLYRRKPRKSASLSVIVGSEKNQSTERGRDCA